MNKVTSVHPRLQHLGMTTANIDAMLIWYRNVLGMNLVHRTASAAGGQKDGPVLKAAWVTNDEANHRLAFVELPGLIPTPKTPGAIAPRCAAPISRGVTSIYRNGFA